MIIIDIILHTQVIIDLIITVAGLYIVCLKS